MLEPSHNAELPEIPAKRYFTIGEVSELCEVKPHVLRYWEQEFTQLKPVKRRGNRRYYQRQDVILIRQIRTLLYEQGFTIGGARQRMAGNAANPLGEETSMKAMTAPRAAASAAAAVAQLGNQQIRELIEEVEEALSHLA
ncbi:MAG: MerR family transcriptional regulator [Pseudomonadota bacterium]